MKDELTDRKRDLDDANGFRSLCPANRSTLWRPACNAPRRLPPASCKWGQGLDCVVHLARSPDTLIVLIYFGLDYPSSRSTLSVDLALSVFLLAVLANVAYCAAYPVDIFVCASSYGEQWRKYRWVVFMVGLLFAAIITRFFALGTFESGSVRAR
jgi:hypothetical protein